MEFIQTESTAYMGEYLDYDNLPPVEYKYFTRIRQLGTDSRAGKLSNPNEIASLRNKYYAQYQQEREMQDKRLDCMKAAEVYIDLAQSAAAKWAEKEFRWERVEWLDSELVEYGGAKYIPFAYVLYFGEKGKEFHSVRIRDVKAESWIETGLDNITKRG